MKILEAQPLGLLKQFAAVIVFFWLYMVGGQSLVWADSESPCEQIESACGHAGYIRGLNNEKDGKDMDKACVTPLLKGQALPDVYVDPETIQKCNDSRKPKSNSRRSRKH